MRVFACAAALFVVGGCNSSPQNPVDAAIVNAAVNQPITCKAGPECDAKWSCASAWIAQNSAFKIQTANELIIQTMGPLPYDATPAFTVTKVANASGDYEISLTAGCDNIFGCIPSIEQSRYQFPRFRERRQRAAYNRASRRATRRKICPCSARLWCCAQTRRRSRANRCGRPVWWFGGQSRTCQRGRAADC